ncbi:Druantia anti-phage system protein DruA [Desulfobulbus alkaliphilus]|uniref:Druantia anti-phage system protein DruA n=1 Tax=Desulfobulbus alkaliphilus TaxID=869814 RepID=UPI001964FD11|nr:Druantia anti-phage system protein DruA [Desulfobulbus alkaliphilus]MBM9538474.1 DUF4338 domain-containing protein [Desulfobulbus alkaliphilus]
MTAILTYRNRTITQDDIAFIKKVIAEYSAEGRTAISRRICHAWDWRQANGQLKDMVCRSLLLILERQHYIVLPPRIKDNNNVGRRACAQYAIETNQEPITGQVKELMPIELRQVRRTPEERLCNSLIQHHHYLGYARPVGEHLKYLAFAGDRVLACLIFSSAPYAMTCRDTFIGWTPEARERNRHLLAYNTRFLILPWVKVPHLASHLLGLAARSLSSDWQQLYNHPIFWIETFIDTERFAGTCYRAANWIKLGLTHGRGKYNKTQQQLTSIKAMYGYPLSRDFRKRLCHG